jgi:hypothetical protein
LGVLYVIQPLDEEIAALLEEMGASVPASDEPSRNPTPAEVRKACSGLKGFTVEFNVKPRSFWQAIIQSAKGDEGTILNLDKFKGAEDEPHEATFEKGSPALILEIVKRLAKQCGPLAVIPDTGEAPIAVTGTASVKTLLKEWEHAQEG